MSVLVFVCLSVCASNSMCECVSKNVCLLLFVTVRA